MEIETALKRIAFAEPERAKRILDSLQSAPGSEDAFMSLLPALAKTLQKN